MSGNRKAGLALGCWNIGAHALERTRMCEFPNERSLLEDAFADP